MGKIAMDKTTTNRTNAAMRTALMIVAAVALLALPLASPVHADGDADGRTRGYVTSSPNPKEVDLSSLGNSNTPGVSGAPRSSRSPKRTTAVKTAVPKPYSLTELYLRSDARGKPGPNLSGQEGTWCVATKTTRSATPFSQTRINQVATRNQRIKDLQYPSCALLPKEQAENAINKVVLPTPVLEIDPGWAITGLPAYLETKGTTTYEAVIPVGSLNFNVKATGQYFVDWGDGTGQWGPYDFEGLPWPEGQIKHVYQYTGNYTVTVRELWAFSWQSGKNSGVLNDRYSEASIPLTVRELQAVRIR